MKILMLNHEFPPVGGGASPVTFELCRQLVKMGHDVDVVTMHYDKLPRFEQVEGFGVYRTPGTPQKAEYLLYSRTCNLCAWCTFQNSEPCPRKHYDVIHCHFMVPGAPLGIFGQ